MPRSREGWSRSTRRSRTRLAALGHRFRRSAILDLPGEVVSGHPDRHVLARRTARFADAFYLKRQHRRRWRERLRNWLAGFGWVSRCERERSHSRSNSSEPGFAAPRWVAAGEDARGRAFLLVEEIDGAVDLRRVLSDNACHRASGATRGADRAA